MEIAAVVFVVVLLIVGAVWEASRRYNDWVVRMAGTGPFGIIYALLISVIMGMYASIVIGTILAAILYMAGGALVGAVFAVRGIGGWGVILLGAGLGLLVYLARLAHGSILVKSGEEERK